MARCVALAPCLSVPPLSCPRSSSSHWEGECRWLHVWFTEGVFVAGTRDASVCTKNPQELLAEETCLGAEWRACAWDFFGFFLCVGGEGVERMS